MDSNAVAMSVPEPPSTRLTTFLTASEKGGANVVVGGLEGVGAGVGGDGGDDAVGDVAGAGHAGSLIEIAEGGGRVGGAHGGLVRKPSMYFLAMQ